MVFKVALLCATPLFAQFDFPSMSARSAALGGVTVVLDDPTSAPFGLASMATSNRACASIAVRQNYFMPDMGYAAAAFLLPVNKGAWGASFINYGNKDYYEQQASLMYGIPIGKYLSLSAAFHYLHSATSDAFYEPLHRLTFSVALQYSPDDLLTVAFRAYNPIAVTAENDDAVHIPSLFSLGASYWMRDELLAIAEVEKNLYNTATLRFGLEYLFREIYALRLGFSTEPIIYSVGLGMQFEHLGINIAMQVHQVLGLTPHISLNYLF